MKIIHPVSGTPAYTKRRRRFDGELAPRELTFSCYRGYPFLARDRSRTWFVEALSAVKSIWSIDLWAWVIMPEHVHLLIAPREPGIDVGKFQGGIKEKVARQGIAWLKEHDPEWLKRITVHEGVRTRHRFWQPGGGYDRNVTEIGTLQSMLDYIHANPVRRGLVTQSTDWEWSSARFYVGMSPVHLEMDRTLPDLGSRE